MAPILFVVRCQGHGEAPGREAVCVCGDDVGHNVDEDDDNEGDEGNEKC